MTKSLYAITLLALITATFSGCAHQQNSNGNANSSAVAAEPTPDKAAIEAQLRALEYDWPRIVKERDGEAVRKLESDDIMLVYPDGADGNKEADVKDIEAGELANEPQEVVDVTVNVLDNDAAVVRSRTRVKSDNSKLNDGKCQTIIHEFRTVDTFVRRNGQWQLVASATVPVRNPEPTETPSPTPNASSSPKGSPTTKASPPIKPSPVRSGTPLKNSTPQ
jgi:ketosteroid isomerase-like protein